MSDRILILGATSGIARALCQQLAAQGHPLVLAGRDVEELEVIAGDLRVRHETSVEVEAFEALDFDGHSAFLQRCLERLGGQMDGVVLCFGYMVDQDTNETDF